MVRIPTHIEPTHLGEMLLEEFLKPMGITQRELADFIKQN
jgi:plasmid maintenance system antidote protein VapI